MHVEGRSVAIEAELTVKSRRRVQAILDELSGRFDAIVYFCAPGPRRCSRSWPARTLARARRPGHYPSASPRRSDAARPRPGASRTAGAGV